MGDNERVRCPGPQKWEFEEKNFFVAKSKKPALFFSFFLSFLSFLLLCSSLAIVLDPATMILLIPISLRPSFSSFLVLSFIVHLVIFQTLPCLSSSSSSSSHLSSSFFLGWKERIR